MAGLFNLECDGRGYWLYNRLPTSTEVKYWLGKPECCYTLTSKGSHRVADTRMGLEDVVRVNRLMWTVPQLAKWQRRLCYHSEAAVKKTFENTMQY